MSDQILAPSDIRLVAGDAPDRDAAIRAAGAILVESGAVTPAYVEAMIEREGSVSTFMGNFLAIPHGTNEAKGEIQRSALSFVRYDEPIAWGSEEVRFVVGIAGIEDEHLEILSKIAIIFSDDDEVQKLLSAPDAAAIAAILAEVNE
ncbi:PTS sugar transporter subunit IIA [Agromyces atrinae]|uniref:Mannitol-specific phosphotransferase enzyme IIA component n=1 Tax=Agromyces atrinae TaxID=592376 RepID=A0A4Q2M856_9MICO|nr:PTS sugar transporter subunit IIA [Agromyces atrinae]MCI2957834.1 PTS sugar transporter subunit IIA [Agromyces atrinae]NYD66858.1 PTS system mannitol-specific IIA component [Agromyces atrinae]RXZ87507.1 PTS mannitol transporter subunit IIA [Agromyces atrinae]